MRESIGCASNPSQTRLEAKAMSVRGTYVIMSAGVEVPVNICVNISARI